MKFDFIIIAGDSGGHIFPALQLIKNISLDKKILFITNSIFSSLKNTSTESNVSVKIFKKQNKFIFFATCLKYLIFNISKFKNSNVIGFGGFLTVIPIIFLYILKVLKITKNKIFIHEQNIIYGLANKINYFFVDNAFISFPKINLKKKEIVVGNYETNLNQINFLSKNTSPKVLVIGGSAGSLEVIDFFISNLEKYLYEYTKDCKFYIQAPHRYIDQIKNKIKKLNITFEIQIFFENINFKEYDLIISRSGSGSLFNILSLTNKVKFIPHLHSRDKHQLHNLNFMIHEGNFINEINFQHRRNYDAFYYQSLIAPFSFKKFMVIFHNETIKSFTI